jgi:hypothetical protein
MRPSLAGLALSALLSLSACGGGGGDTTPAPAPPVAVTPPTTPPVALLPRAEGEPIVLAGVQYDDTEPGQFVNGPGASARFYHVRDLAIDKAGNVFVADAGNCAIRKITPSGAVSTLAGGQRCATPDGDAARFDGAGGNAAFYQLSRMVIDAADNLYVADGAAIRKITPQGVVSTLAGQLAEGEPSADGIGAAARFYGILELAASPNGSLLVQDSTLRPAVEGHWLFCVETRDFNFLREISPQGAVTTLQDTGIHCTSENPSLLADLSDIRITRDGTLYARRRWSIVKRSPGLAPVVIHKLPGSPIEPPFIKWEEVQAPVPDDAGNLYFARAGAGDIVKLAPDGTVSTVLQRRYDANAGDFVGLRIAGLRALTYVGNHDFIFSVDNQIMRVTLK